MKVKDVDLLGNCGANLRGILLRVDRITDDHKVQGMSRREQIQCDLDKGLRILLRFDASDREHDWSVIGHRRERGRRGCRIRYERFRVECVRNYAVLSEGQPAPSRSRLLKSDGVITDSMTASLTRL